MIQSFNKINNVLGELNLPGDKSISHRTVIFSSLAKGKSTIKNLSNGEDVKSTMKCFEMLGCDILSKHDSVIVNGKGYKGFSKPKKELDAGNSGTTARLLSGILIVQNFNSTIIGDESLSQRPMKRILHPLKLMGGKIFSSEKDTLPLKIFPSENLNSITYELSVPSAQVKSAILLAGLHLEEETCVIENEQSRNHTEILLNLKTEKKEDKILIYSSKKNYPEPNNYFIPSDISTAAFFIVIALLSKNSSLIIKNVTLNPTRMGIVNILKQMGGNIEFDNLESNSNELFGDLIVKSSELHNIEIDKKIIPNIIDEIPILSVAGLFAEGDFIINNAKELRVKESDRINSLVFNYKILGLNVEEFEDGFCLSGKIKNYSPTFESFNDHRIAMAFSILSLLLDNGGKINNFECVKISNPNFLTQLKLIIR
ncbi:MAG: 3-phosphoshikimate 1-carboxyvinyltransferase [Ignavibacterium sp.]